MGGKYIYCKEDVVINGHKYYKGSYLVHHIPEAELEQLCKEGKIKLVNERPKSKK
jgi:hypothetical protein